MGVADAHRPGAPRLTPRQFVIAFGVVSLFADVVYEGARAITGPYLASFGASAATVGFVTGFGEAVALIGRLASGPLADRTRRHWTLSIAGYAMTALAVPLIAVTQGFWPAAGLVVAERFGKAVRTPARDTMLSHAGSDLGRGLAFALHEAMDQMGAIAGPLLCAAMIAASGYPAAFGVLAAPGALAILTLVWLSRAVPRPSDYEPAARAKPATADTAPARLAMPPRFWLYLAFTAVSMAGFPTFAVLAFHQQASGLVAPALIPVTYAAAMAAAALAALASGWLYDRFGLRALTPALALSALVPLLAFSGHAAVVWLGTTVWGAAMGMHESTRRAAVADLAPAHRRGAAYGLFAAGYGVAWLAGATITGFLYEHARGALTGYGLATQAIALALLATLLKRPAAARNAEL